jgi:AcrR family transcriptional regulator
MARSEKIRRGSPRRAPDAPRNRRTRRSTADIVGRIVGAARAQFERAGFTRTTTAQIARAADVTEAQLFQYFGSKANLFRETVFKPLDGQLRQFIDNHMAQLGETANLAEMARLYTTELQRFIKGNSPLLTSLVVAQTYDDGNAHGVGKINSLQAYFDRGAATMTARVKGKPKVAPQLMVRVSFAAVLGCIMFEDWIFPPDLAPNEEIAAAINDFVLEGIGANQ